MYIWGKNHSFIKLMLGKLFETLGIWVIDYLRDNKMENFCWQEESLDSTDGGGVISWKRWTTLSCVPILRPQQYIGDNAQKLRIFPNGHLGISWCCLSLENGQKRLFLGQYQRALKLRIFQSSVENAGLTYFYFNWVQFLTCFLAQMTSTEF